MYGPISSILPTIYAKYYGLDLAFIGMVLLVSRVFDAVTDPVIGYLSDKTTSPIGQRKPWMIVGFTLVLFAIYRLYVPPVDVQPMHFMVWFILLYLFLTIAEIPYAAWQAEITRDYRVRSKVVAYRAVFAGAGGLLFAVSPMLPMFSTHEMTPEVLKVLAIVIVVLLPIAVLIAVFYAPVGKPVATKASGTFISLLRGLAKNRPFLIFIVSYMFTGLAAGMQQIMGFLYFDTYLGIGDRFPVILLSMSIAQLAAVPVWLWLANKIGKHRAFAVGNVLSVIFSIGIIFLKPGPDVFPAFMAIWICMMFCFSAVQVIPAAIMGDIVDYDTLKSGSNRAGQYFAVFTMAVKFNLGVGGGLAFFLVDGFGYDVAATLHDRTSIIGIWIAISFLPSLFYLISSVIMWQFPIDERRHGIIRRRIESLKERIHAG